MNEMRMKGIQMLRRIEERNRSYWKIRRGRME
jgi:hypothetical protein